MRRYMPDMQLPFSMMFKIGMCVCLETLAWAFFVVVYSHSAPLTELYLEDIAIIGSFMSIIAQDASAAHLIAFLLAVFSVVIPVTLFVELFDQDAFSDIQKWLSEQHNRLILTMAVVVIALIVGLEAVSLYTTISKNVILDQNIIIDDTNNDALMQAVANNKFYALCLSLVIATINLALSFFTAYTFHNLKKYQE